MAGDRRLDLLSDGAGSSNNLVVGNYIGTDVTGQVDLGNSTDGVAIYNDSSNNTIGWIFPSPA